MKGEFIPELEDMAFKMKTKEVQGIVKTKFGYHILRKLSQTRLKFNENTQTRIRRVLEKKNLTSILKNFK